ncbi:flagellar biosynthesis anti-sigma factor FlgM [Clostridium pasteurianum]|nr:flagellar biosynthesis anti-sigma factor FlgM [Clostridium pasteurianum]AOZ75128.1 flagellar biosynthesis anti-sigma factor FlgM [Clostridium pasteurianum DSM 525 = ATCC 6013]AOZ78923.1 flagellar biosynthesis anti-sigma factor FlgM [Clostridium pasteurianum]ELP59738.1 negative regulator of flagellin synthesis [Clostridium pasteurianum DSM 525 = ATCC 6013]OMH22610.1 flagellar biosynthesis anti-sigma factor FlgM [Clostridium pasteurianum]UZW15996.1 flagellar biosynthesis anti-sigma factor Flg
MKINGVGLGKVLQMYNNNSNNKNISENKTPEKSAKDSLEISKLGKSLSAYSTEDNFGTSKAKIEEIKKQIENGTYNRDSKLVAQKLLDHIKGKGV